MECVQHSNMKQQMCLEEQHCHVLQQLRTKDGQVSLDGRKEKSQSSTNPSNDSPEAIEVGVQALCHPPFLSAVIVRSNNQ